MKSGSLSYKNVAIAKQGHCVNNDLMHLICFRKTINSQGDNPTGTQCSGHIILLSFSSLAVQFNGNHNNILYKKEYYEMATLYKNVI